MRVKHSTISQWEEKVLLVEVKCFDDISVFDFHVVQDWWPLNLNPYSRQITSFPQQPSELSKKLNNKFTK